MCNHRVCVLCGGSLVNAAMVEYALSVDDYGTLTLDGQRLLLIDTPGQSWQTTGPLDLSPGWHDIEIDYKNRWGTNVMAFYEVTDVFTDVPRENLRSLDAQGQLVSGLKADYYDLSGNYLQTVYGEGPIHHGSIPVAPLYTAYQGVENTLWAGTYDRWDQFEERLSGQVFVTPLPGAVLLGFLSLGMAGLKLRCLA
jgi:hypothetical protein